MIVHGITQTRTQVDRWWSGKREAHVELAGDQQMQLLLPLLAARKLYHTPQSATALQWDGKVQTFSHYTLFKAKRSLQECHNAFPKLE